MFRFKTTFDYDFGKFDSNGGLICWKETNKGYQNGITPNIYRIGDKIGQFEMKKKDLYTVKQVGDISETGRGGFGSTDRQAMINKYNSDAGNYAN